tara:strand:- start:337 stop:1596 length:1260 start_codon:yes stop_codon:yes gene_type:complete
MTLNKFTFNYFLVLFSLIPVTFLIGSAVSVFNIFLIDLSFVIFVILKKDFTFLKSKPIIYLFALYVYLVFNSFISLEFSEGLARNFGFIRMIILFAAFNYFLRDKIFFGKMIKFWFAVITIVLVDVYIENFSGQNILGYTGKLGFIGETNSRIVSFFKDEQIVGTFINGFYLILIGFLFNEYKDRSLLFGFTIALLFLLTIILTGERSTSIKAFLGLGLFLFFLKEIDLKKKIAFFLLINILVFTVIMSNSFLKMRFINQITSAINLSNLAEKNDPTSRLGSKYTVYYELYRSGLQVFKNNKVFGVGNKNYRVEACKEGIRFYYCSTHPHQIYFELLSEHGIIGSFIIIFILFKLFFSKIINTFKSSNYLKSGSLIYMTLIFTPLLPSGAFFNNFLLTIFIINLSIFYALDKDLNIFGY